MSEDKSDQDRSKHRVSFDVVEPQLQIMDKMKEDCGFETHSELINAAMTLFHWSIKETKRGRRIATLDPDDEKTLELISMPALESVKRD